MNFTQLGWDLRLGLLWLALYAGGVRAAAPIATDVYGDAGKADRLYVLLPGIRDRKDDFRKEGFVAIAQDILKNRKDVALVAVDAHYGYYRNRTVDTRIYEDVIQRYPGKRITLVGISLGGFGALMVAQEHPDRVDELLLLSPFLGPDAYLKRVKQRDFAPRKSDGLIEQRLNLVWPFLLKSKDSPRISIGYGDDDKFLDFYAMLRQQRPDIPCDVVPGRHDWKTWNALWGRWLRQQPG